MVIHPFKFAKEGSILSKLLRSFCLFIAKKRATQQKVVCCFGFGATVTHSAQSILKILKNLCSFRWLNFNRNLD